MPSPAVSVCLPTYNYGAFLAGAVQSVLDQTYTDFELLVYDDASTDDSVEVMRRFEDDERVSFVRHEKNQGLFANFNLSIEQARGRYVKYLCADDWLDRRFLAETVPLLDAHADLVMAATANWLVDVNGELIGEQRAPFGDGPHVGARTVVEELARWGNVVGMPTNTLIRRDALTAVGGFDAGYAPASDVHLWLKLLARGDMGWVPRPRCFVRIHSRHTHDYGPDPTESIFTIWRDAASLPGTQVSEKLARNAMRREAQHSLLYVAAHLLKLRFKAARKLLAFAGKHVNLMGATLRFLVALPVQARDQAERIFALRTGRMVVYTPRPRAGEPLQRARSALAAEAE